MCQVKGGGVVGGEEVKEGKGEDTKSFRLIARFGVLN